MLKRHQIQVLRDAGHSQEDTARLAGVSERTVRRIDAEPSVLSADTAAERERRRIGRPAKAEQFRDLVRRELEADPSLLSVEVVRRARLAGYAGGKTALYRLIAELRPSGSRVMVRASWPADSRPRTIGSPRESARCCPSTAPRWSPRSQASAPSATSSVSTSSRSEVERSPT